MVLALLTLKANRRAAAWLIWLPIGLVLLLSSMRASLPPGTDFFMDAVAAMGFGLAAVWLLAHWLRRSHRVLTFFCVLTVLLAFAALALIAWRGWEGMNSEGLVLVIWLALSALITTVALSLGGWLCRRGFRPVAFYVWLLLTLGGLWFALAAPFFILAEITNDWRMGWGEFFVPVLSVAAGHFILLLPFLILSSAAPFFRARLLALLQMTPDAPPPVLPTTDLNFEPTNPKESL